MSVNKFPEASGPKKFPFGANGSFTYDQELSSGVYDVEITGDDSFAASANALTVVSPEGYSVPVHLDTGQGIVALPFQANTLNAASITTPAVASFDRVRYDQGDAPTGVSVSFDSNYSGSYVVDMTIPGSPVEAYAYYANGERDALGTTFPASIVSPNYDLPAAFSASTLAMLFTYEDDKSLLSAGANTTQTVPVPPGTWATGGTIVSSGGFRYHAFTSNGTLSIVNAGDIEYIVVAGGGGGGSSNDNVRAAGGGGAGGFVSGSFSGSAGASFAVIVGAGGAGGINGFDGDSGNTSLLGTTASAAGGGGGGRDAGNGFNGGSGGGAGGFASGTIFGGIGIAGQGFNGETQASDNDGGGGGGATEAGGTDGDRQGGDGTNSASVWASATSTGAGGGYYAGGGGGGYAATSPGSGAAGLGGGPGGANAGQNGSAAQATTGGGGGGAAITSGADRNGGTGGGGVVIVRYSVV